MIINDIVIIRFLIRCLMLVVIFSSTLVFGESSCFIESGDEVGVLESIESLLLISIVSLSGIVIAGIELSLDSIVVGLSSKLSLLIIITGGSGVN